MTPVPMRRRLLAAGAALPWMPTAARAQAGWRPDRPIEYIVPAGAGAALDMSARQFKEIVERRKRVSAPVLVSNKPGGAGAIALNGLAMQPGNGHLVSTYTHSLINSRLLNVVPMGWRDVTPIAVMFEEAILAVVRTESPLKTGGDLVAALRKDPSSVSIGVATSVGNHIPMAIAKPMKAAGVDVSKMTIVPFKSSAESMTAMLGGHIDMISASAPNLTVQLEAGRIRPLAVATAEHIGAPLANVPTWREQGVAADYVSAQGLIGPKGMTADQLAWWTETLREVHESDEWKQFLVKQNWKPRFMPGAEMTRFLESEEAVAKGLLTDLGLLK
ncbi:MAG TPA: tripartite tricarboxylate transporter substrate binding protein [Burkholderiaceae bacterium]|nr:tripartite tricarboxylate transporter substrate binding protein [Burkholderiaceae bacterium]